MGRPYPEIDLRTITDVDLVARRAEYPQLERLLQHLGFTPSTARSHELRHEHHVQYFRERQPRRVMAELHWTPFYMLYSSPAADEAALSRAAPHTYDGTDFTLLDPEDTLLSLVLHLAMHRYRGQLKWAVDIAAALDHFGPQLSWPTLWDRAERLGASRALAFGLWLCGHVLQEPGVEVSPRRELRWHLLRHLTPHDGLVHAHPQPESWRRTLTDLSLCDTLLDGLRHVAFKATEVHERKRPHRLPGWMTRRGLQRSR